MRRAVVVGAGLAGLRAAQTLRRRGYAGELTVVGDEEWRPYNRPPLSKAVLAGTAEPASCILPTDDLEASWLLGRTATALDTGRRVVTLDGGDEVPYDGLVIATGCRARPWPRPLELDGVYTLRTLADAIRLRDVLPARPRVVLVGAGFIGCEVAATLRGHDLAVSMIDIASHPMPQLGPEIGARAAQLHAGHGVDLHLGVSVESFEGHDRVEAVRLSDGRRLEADVVLVGLGAQPNTEWLEGSGLRLRAGAVLCDEHCLAVGTTDVVAAGDVAAWPYPTAGAVLRVEHWTNGAEMAMRAATNLLAAPHERTPHAPVFTFWSDQYDVKIRVAGLPGRAASLSVVQADPDRGLLVVEGRREGRLVGAVTFNSSRDHLRHCRELAAAAA